MRVAIIEDEGPAARRLERLILHIRPNTEIAGICDSVESAVELLSTARLDLIFMDIHLADGLSFAIFEHTEVKAPVIFTTAYDEYALKAFSVNSIDYLLKPIHEDSLKGALSKFDRLQPAKAELVQQLLRDFRADRKVFRSRFLVRNGNALSFVTADQVAWIMSASGTTFLVTHNNDRFMLAATLDELEQELDPAAFFRISRACIASISSIRKIEPYLSNRLMATLQPDAGEYGVVSRQRAAAFKAWLDGL
jgi:DNA-binding LytR/AlgR family response regulator